MISRFLWTVAIGFGLICVLVSLGVGRTPFTEGLFAVAAVAGGLGIGVDRARR